MMRQTKILQVLFIYQPHGKDLGRISKWYSTWTVHCWCEFWEENITTGNELEGESLTEFSKKLDVNSLYEYTKNVMFSINAMLQKLDYQQMKRHFCLFMINCMKNMILKKRRRYSDRICMRGWRCWKEFFLCRQTDQKRNRR